MRVEEAAITLAGSSAEVPRSEDRRRSRKSSSVRKQLSPRHPQKWREHIHWSGCIMALNASLSPVPMRPGSGWVSYSSSPTSPYSQGFSEPPKLLGVTPSEGPDVGGGTMLMTMQGIVCPGAWRLVKKSAPVIGNWVYFQQRLPLSQATPSKTSHEVRRGEHTLLGLSCLYFSLIQCF